MNLPNTDSMKLGPEWLRHMNDLNSDGSVVSTPLSAKLSTNRSAVYGRFSRLHDRQYSIDKLLSVWAPSTEAPSELKQYDEIYEPDSSHMTPLSMKAFMEREKKHADEIMKENANQAAVRATYNRPTRGGGTGGSNNIRGGVGGGSDTVLRGGNSHSSRAAGIRRGGGGSSGGRWPNTSGSGVYPNEEDDLDVTNNKRSAPTHLRGRGRGGVYRGSRGGGSSGGNYPYSSGDDNDRRVHHLDDGGPAGDESDVEAEGSGGDSSGGEWQQVGHSRQRQISQNSLESENVDKQRSRGGNYLKDSPNNNSGNPVGGGSTSVNVTSISRNANQSGAAPLTTGSNNWRQRTRSGSEKQAPFAPQSQQRRIFHPPMEAAPTPATQGRLPHQRSLSGGEQQQHHQSHYNKRSRNSSRTEDIVLENFYEDPSMAGGNVEDHHPNSNTHDSSLMETSTTSGPSVSVTAAAATVPPSVNVDVLAAQLKELAAKSGSIENLNETAIKEVLQRCLSTGNPTSLQEALISDVSSRNSNATTVNHEAFHSPDPTVISWFYLDPKRNQHGPFKNESMRQWLDNGYFPDSLQLRRSCDSRFISLSAYKELYNNNNPFLDNLVVPVLTPSFASVAFPTEPVTTAPIVGHSVQTHHPTPERFGAPGLNFSSNELAAYYGGASAGYASHSLTTAQSRLAHSVSADSAVIFSAFDNSSSNFAYEMHSPVGSPLWPPVGAAALQQPPPPSASQPTATTSPQKQKQAQQQSPHQHSVAAAEVGISAESSIWAAGHVLQENVMILDLGGKSHVPKSATATVASPPVTAAVLTPPSGTAGRALKASTNNSTLPEGKRPVKDVDEEKQRRWEKAYNERVELDNQQRLQRLAQEEEQRAIQLAEEQAAAEADRQREMVELAKLQRAILERRREEERLAQLPQLPHSVKWAVNNAHAQAPNLVEIQRIEAVQQQHSVPSAPHNHQSSMLNAVRPPPPASQQPVPPAAVHVPSPRAVGVWSTGMSTTKTLAEIQAEEMQTETHSRQQTQQQQPHGNQMPARPSLWANKVKQGATPSSPTPAAPPAAAAVVAVNTSSTPPSVSVSNQPMLSIWSAPPPPVNSMNVTPPGKKVAGDMSRSGDVTPVTGAPALTILPTNSSGAASHKQQQLKISGKAGSTNNKVDKKANELTALRNVMSERQPMTPLMQWAKHRVSELCADRNFDVITLIEITMAMPDDEVMEMFKQYLDDSDLVRGFTVEFLERRRELQRSGDGNNDWITASSHRPTPKPDVKQQQKDQIPQQQGKSTQASGNSKKKKKIHKSTNQTLRIQ